MILDASQTASLVHSQTLERAHGEYLKNPSPCKVQGHTLLAGEFVDRALRAPLGLKVPAQMPRAPPTLSGVQDTIPAQPALFMHGVKTKNV